jgi:hypothetical protein
MDEELVFVVEDAFCIRGRGTILMPGVPLASANVKIGDELEMRLPTGEKAGVTVLAIDWWHSRANSGRSHAPVLIASEQLGDSAQLIGTEVWTTSTGPRSRLDA